MKMNYEDDCHACKDREEIIEILVNDMKSYTPHEITTMLTELPERFECIDQGPWEPEAVVLMPYCVECQVYNKAVMRIKHKLEEVEIMGDEEFFYEEARSLTKQL